MAAMPARPNIRKVIREYPLAAAASFEEGAVLLITTGEVDEAGADPATIAGFAAHESGALPDTSVQLVYMATPESTFVLQGTSAPVAADEGVEYGLVKDGDGIWIVDKTDVVNTRVVVEKVYTDREEFEVRVLTANIQLAT